MRVVAFSLSLARALLRVLLLALSYHTKTDSSCCRRRFLPKGMSKQQKEAQRQFKAERQGKVKGYRAQANYGETKFRKP